MGDVLDLEGRRSVTVYPVFALCLPCSHRWVVGVEIHVSLFKLTCPRCEAQESFASFMSEGYYEHLKDWGRQNEEG